MSRRNFCELDLLDIATVRKAADLLDGYQRAMQEAAFSQYKLEDEAFTSQYYETAGMVINAQPLFMQRYCCCGMSGDNRCRHWCNQWKYCPRCAREKGRKLIKRFGHLYDGKNWQHLTMSFQGAVNYRDHRHLCDNLWNVLDAAYLSVEGDWQVRGAIYAEELALLSFLPATCMPHAHVLIEGEDVGDAQVESLEEAIDRQLRADPELEEIELAADVLVKKIGRGEFEPEGYLHNALAYLRKPINLSTPYRSALIQHSPVEVNSDVRDVLVGLPYVGARRKQIRYRGSLSSNTGRRRRKKRTRRSARRRRSPQSAYQEMQARQREEISLAE
jgi:hypothetical protein